MSNGIWVAASGASTQLTALDTTANNLANASTPGYKAEQATFQEHLLRRIHAGHAVLHMKPSGVSEVRADLRTGPIQVTHQPLDVAIRDESFFSVLTPGGERFTRNGSFKVSPDNILTTAEGLSVLNAERRPVQITAEARNVSIREDGTLLVDGQESGNLVVVRFRNPAGLEKDGSNLFRATAASGAPQKAEANLETGALEMTNTSVVKGMTDIVSTTRTFQAIEKVIEAFSEIDRRAATGIIRSQ